MNSIELRKFGLIVGSIFSLIGLYPLVRSGDTRWAFLGVGVVLILTAVIRPVWLERPYRIWMTVGHAIGRVNTTLLLSVIFYLILTPVGLIRRVVTAIGRAPDRFAFRPGVGSTWIRRPPCNLKESMKRTY